MIRRLIAGLAGILLAALTPLALAQTPPAIPAQLTLNCVAPSVNTDGSAVWAGEITSYRIWIDTKPIPDAPSTDPTVTVSGTTLTVTQALAVAAGSTLHARIQTCDGMDCSVLTNEVTAPVTLPTPGVPTSVTIKIVINPSP